MEHMSPPASGIELLPDPLLGRIFSAAGRGAGDTIALVSKRWHDVFYSEPALWGELVLDAASLLWADQKGQSAHWFECKARLLQRIGGCVHQLVYSQMLEWPGGHVGLQRESVDMEQLAARRGSEWQLGSSVLACLSPASLQVLILKEAPLDAAAAAVLGGMSSLTQLQVDGDSDVPTSVAAALPSLPQLRQLILSGARMPQALPAALQHLAQLTALCCYASNGLPELTAVYSLTQLRELEWQEEQREVGMMRPDVHQLLARLPHLEHWSLGSWHGHGQHGLSKMQVGNATLERYDAFKCSRQGGAVERVQLDGVTDMPSLQQLLAAGLPQPSQLRRLGLFNSMLSAPALLGCPFLGPLTELILSGCTFSDGGAAPALEALLQQAPRLQNLSLVACLNHQPFPSAQPFPPALVSRTGLQRLSLQINDLADLPPGPYLSSLQSLDLRTNSFRRLPPALSAATGLTELSLAGNFHLALTTADVQGVLLRLPRLSRVYMGVTQTPAPVLWRLFTAAPALQVTESPGAAQWALAE